uniref:Uncharacterized protein n=1 Tax=Timema monikensis TaxID=170555 RepID=A0A7R9HTT9_9NEOP|nr:unnamed protein product [Timema monikensis]
MSRDECLNRNVSPQPGPSGPHDKLHDSHFIIRYLRDSLKKDTRQSRGLDNRIAVKPGVKIPMNFKRLLGEDKNKEELFCRLANDLTAMEIDEKNVLSTYKEICFTGFDTVSTILGVGKNSAWRAWMSFRDVDVAFQEYLGIPKTLTPNILALSVLRRFVVLMYHPTATAVDVNEARQILFTKKNRGINKIPPTSDALLQHLIRVIFQCNICKNCLTANPMLLDPRSWRWKTSDDFTYEPVWTTIPDVSTHCTSHLQVLKKLLKKTEWSMGIRALV